jgi:hypothetical protein
VPYRKEGTIPRPTLKIVGSQRDALYEQERNHLAGLGTLSVALECQKDYATAEPLAIVFGEDVRLDLAENRLMPSAARFGGCYCCETAVCAQAR